MRTKNFGEFHIRKWYLQIEDTLANETGVLADGEPVRKIVIGAAVHNAFSGQFVRDLNGWVRESEALGQEYGRGAQGQWADCKDGRTTRESLIV